MTQGIFLDASVLDNKEESNIIKQYIKQNNLIFEFPEGLTELRLIEECRALNALDLSNPDNFDLMYDITMQMLAEKPVGIFYKDEKGNKIEVCKFVVTNRYMDLRGILFINEYPIVVNWLVEFIAGFLSKKLPLSLKDIQTTMREKEELMKKSLKN
jgi:hypothetical protein